MRSNRYLPTQGIASLRSAISEKLARESALVCPSEQVLVAANLGFSATVVHDACAAFARNSDTAFDKGPALTPDESHRAALAHLNGEFARVVATEHVVAL